MTRVGSLTGAQILSDLTRSMHSRLELCLSLKIPHGFIPNWPKILTIAIDLFDLPSAYSLCLSTEIKNLRSATALNVRVSRAQSCAHVRHITISLLLCSFNLDIQSINWSSHQSHTSIIWTHKLTQPAPVDWTTRVTVQCHARFKQSSVK